MVSGIRALVAGALLLAAIMCFTPASSLAQTQVRSISYPAISSDGQTVYFSCWGDIWSAPADGSALARRLTDNVAYDGRPIPSPDGTKLAFLSNRFGNFDIFVMPEQGGAATRLTWDSTVDYPYDWNRDGTAILEYAMRQDLWALSTYEVQLDGTRPRRLTGPDHDDHTFACYLGDDTRLVYSRGPGDWSQKRYHGSATYDLWMVDTKSGKHTQLTDYDGKDLWPQPSPDGRFVYFVSDRDGTENIWRLEVKSGGLSQITTFAGDGPRWPRISSDGDELVFERLGKLWKVDLASNETKQLMIEFAPDPKHEMELDGDMGSFISEYKVSPNGNYIAVVQFGDVFLLKNPDAYKEDKPDQDLSRTFQVVQTPGREMHLNWAPDSTKITYVSDRDGQYDVYTYDFITKTETQVTDTPDEEWYPSFAPKGNHLAYYRGQRLLLVRDMDSGEESVLVEGQLRNGPWSLGYEWAPDGYWLTYTESVLDYRADVFIINIEDRDPVNVSYSPDWCEGGRWSADGKYLLYFNWNANESDVWLVELDPEKSTYDTGMLFPADMPEDKPEPEAQPEAAGEADGSGEEKDGASEAEETSGGNTAEEQPAEPEHLKINLDRIHLRAEAVTTMQGMAYDAHFDPNSSYILFASEHEGGIDWWTTTIEGGELNRIAPVMGNESPQWSPDGSKLYFLGDGRLSAFAMQGPSAAGREGVALVSEVYINQYQAWEQMLKDGWRHLRDGFYDAGMNGADWDGVLAKYLARIPYISTSYEYGQLYREMLGELGASHLGYYMFGEEWEAPADVTRSLGVEFDFNDPHPGWLVTKVTTDGPAYQPGSRLYPGDMVLSVDGQDLPVWDNWSRRLRNNIGKPVELKVRSGEEALTALAGEAGGEADKAASAERTVVIMPVPSMALRQLEYEQWVMDNRSQVDRLSAGRIAYQHIQEMDYASLQKFRRELFTLSRDKDAVIIDVRFNGGGNISEDLLDILDRKPFAIEAVRQGQKTIQPALLWDKPIVVLINAESYSDAEYFPHGMKELGLGTIIGEPTGGNVIGTYDFPLMDGSILRVPAWGIWLLDGTDMEGNGVQPDLYVDIDPEKLVHGQDSQIQAAVKYLLNKI